MRWWPTFGRSAKATRRKAPHGTLARERAQRRDAGAARRRRGHMSWAVLLLMLALGTVASVTVMYRRTPMALHYVVGQVTDRYVYSTVSFQYVDVGQTAKRREQAAQRVPPVYRRNPLVVESAVQVLNELRQVLGDVSPPVVVGDEPDTSRAQSLVAQLDVAGRELLAEALEAEAAQKVLRELIETALHAGIANREDIEELVADSGEEARITLMLDEGGNVWSPPVVARDLRTPEDVVPTVCDRFLASYPKQADSLRPLLAKVVAAVLQANLTYHTTGTREARQQAKDAVEEVTRTVPPNEVLLRPGQVLVRDDLVKLTSHHRAVYEDRQSRRHLLDQLVTMLLCMVLVGGAAACLTISVPAVVRDRGMLGALILGLSLQMVLTRTTANLYFLWLGSSPFVYSALPLAFSAMLLTPLIGAPAAVWSGVLGAVVAGLQSDETAAFRIFLVGTAATLVATYMIQGARRRAQIYRAGLAAGGATFLLELLFAFRAGLVGAAVPQVLLSLSVHALLSGMAVAISVSALLPLFEFIFGLVTDVTLLELTDLNHPALRRLQLEAPGTYHHSITMATVVEQAAEAIGANPLLARVCAYFHDIGKLSKPHYFTENNREGNPHDELTPRMSSLVILNHVKEGMDLARLYKLKRPIREAIEQHHGTTLVSFFYQKAQKAGNGGDSSSVQEGDYRYPGPRPIRREIAILSIADCCEAAARSLARPTPERIGALVDQLVVNRVRDHQLDNAELTFAELTIVRRCIVRTLTAMMHTRISYPPSDEEKDERPAHQSVPPSTAEKTKRPAEDAQPGGDS